MSKKSDTPTIVGRVIASALSNGLLLWAAFETNGLLRGLLVGYLVFVAVSLIVFACIHEVNKAKTAERPLYGDVHISGYSGGVKR